MAESFTPMPPLKMSAIPAWAAGQALGAKVADGILDANSDFKDALEEADKVEDFKKMMQGLMGQVTKSMARTTDFLDELDDGEEDCAATAIFK